eukprot:scaffold1813_cov134-Skeletonema_dohrnii-CCMP3373.AAC.10
MRIATISDKSVVSSSSSFNPPPTRSSMARPSASPPQAHLPPTTATYHSTIYMRIVCKYHCVCVVGGGNIRIFDSGTVCT